MNLIPIAYLNEVCFLSLNEDDKKYQMNLDLAQDQLSDVIGAEFYEQIVSQYTSTSFSADNLALYDPHIKKYLAWQTYFNLQGFVNSNHTPTGNREFIDENSTIVADVKQYALERNIGNRLKYFKNKLINFLDLEQEKDSTKYPMYTCRCKTDFGFAITSVDKRSDVLLKINKSIVSNE